MSGKGFILVFSNKKHQIYTKEQIISIWNKVSEDFFVNLIINHTYKVVTKVHEKIFLLFLDFLLNDIDFPISPNNFLEFQILSSEFCLKNRLEPNINLTDHISDIISTYFHPQNPIDKSIVEQFLAERLDFCLKKHTNELALIPLNSLFNIFNHIKRKLTDHNLAYDFISEMTQTHDLSFSILFNSLDGNELTEEKLQDSLDKKEDHLGFMPLIDKNTKIKKIQKVTIHTSPEGFNGLLNNLLIKTNNNIKNEVIIQASSKNPDYPQGDPEMVVNYNNKIPCQTQSVQTSGSQFIFIN